LNRAWLTRSVCAEIGLAEATLVELVGRDASLREVWEDLLLVSEALDYWVRTTGPDTQKALQYRELKRDRVEEIHTHLRHRGIPTGAA
jgi:hypothetical protein